MEETDYKLINITYAKYMIMQQCKFCTKENCDGCSLYELLNYLDDPGQSKGVVKNGTG
jgi:hypothetical protein